MEKELREKIAEEKRDLVANLNNEIVVAFSKYSPQPEIAVFVLEMVKFEILNEVYKRQFSPKPITPMPMGGK